MTVRVERAIEVPADIEAVWDFIADPGKRAAAISVVEDFDVHDNGRATWHVRLPIPMVSRTIAVETRERNRDPPHSVSFEGRSPIFSVVGEHRLESIDGTTRLTNSFVVDGSLPGVERFFERRLDDELSNLETALRAELEESA
ncbi:MAG: CoxG family protein [Salinirussus sp.]